MKYFVDYLISVQYYYLFLDIVGSITLQYDMQTSRIPQARKNKITIIKTSKALNERSKRCACVGIDFKKRC